jgi:hypothetical protein
MVELPVTDLGHAAEAPYRPRLNVDEVVSTV